jgi:hypothetical protein
MTKSARTQGLGEYPQAVAEQERGHFMETIKSDRVLWILAHGTFAADVS